MEDNIEKLIQKTGMPRARSKFKEELKENLFTSTNFEKYDLMKEMYIQEPKPGLFSIFAKLSLSTMIASVFLCFFISTVTAYYSIPTVKENVNSAFGISPKGKLEITSTPKDSKIFINGKLYGQTPYNVSLKEGNYFILVQKNGYEDYESYVQITKYKTSKIDVNLEALDSSLFEDLLIYNNEKFNFGIQYPANWDIQESTSQESKFLTSIEGPKQTITLDFSANTKNSNLNIAKMDENGFVFETNNVGNVRIITKYISNCDNLLIIKAEFSEYISKNTDTYRKTSQLIETAWLECKLPYKQPTTDVSDRFIWQMDNSTYSINFDGSDFRQIDSLNNIRIRHLSSDGKWILYQNNGGIYLADTLGQNINLLIPAIRSQGNIKTLLDIQSSGWSNDSKYFVYKLQILDYSKCQSNCEGREEKLNISPDGPKAGFYLFDLTSGKSSYLADSENGFIANWDHLSRHVYLNEETNSENNIFTLKKYSINDTSNYEAYSLENTGKWWTYQYDVHDLTSIVISASGTNSTKLLLANINDGKINIVRELETSGWADNQWPKFDKTGRYIMTHGSRYYDLETQNWNNYHVNNNFDGVFFINNSQLLLLEKNSQNNSYNGQAGIYLYNLETKTFEKEFWAQKNNRDVYFPMPHLN